MSCELDGVELNSMVIATRNRTNRSVVISGLPPSVQCPTVPSWLPAYQPPPQTTASARSPEGGSEAGLHAFPLQLFPPRRCQSGGETGFAFRRPVMIALRGTSRGRRLA